MARDKSTYRVHKRNQQFGRPNTGNGSYHNREYRQRIGSTTVRVDDKRTVLRSDGRAIRRFI